MNDIIQDYLDLRVRGIDELQMPRPRPKHHMLSHYPALYYENGPLKDVWAMRMERLVIIIYHSKIWLNYFLL